jgi:N-acetylglutamate synthase-like GNAT family acetyltransferase
MTKAQFHLRAAATGDSSALSALAWRAKAYWGYSASQLEAWRSDLEIAPQSIEAHWTLCAESGDGLVGVVQLKVACGAADILHLWIDPEAMGQGIGTTLLDAAIAHCKQLGLSHLAIDADPNAEAFYAARGAARVGEVPAPIDGAPDRVRPQTVIDF